VNWLSLHQWVFQSLWEWIIWWIRWSAADSDRESLTDWLADVCYRRSCFHISSLDSELCEVVTIPTTRELITSLWRQLACVWRHSVGARSGRSQIIFDIVFRKTTTIFSLSFIETNSFISRCCPPSLFVIDDYHISLQIILFFLT